MLTDYWVIAQFTTQIGSWILLSYSTIISIAIIRNWNINSNASLQINLERKTYLVGMIAYMILIMQLFVLLFFLQTVNQHFPTLIRGAMCATGTLNANAYGNVTLWIKLSSIIIYAIFITFEYLDNKSPNFPLTSFKYYFLLPAWVFLSADIILSFLYFYNLTPNIITTCCSVVFLGNEQNFEHTHEFSSFNLMIFLFVFCLFVWNIIYFFIKNKIVIKTISSFAIIYFSLFFLQNFFVKYIYGLPNHLCLFDMFFWEYNGIGFVWFGMWIAFAWTNIAEFASVLVEKKLDFSVQFYLQYLKKVQLVSFLCIIFIPILYYFAWQGEL